MIFNLLHIIYMNRHIFLSIELCIHQHSITVVCFLFNLFLYIWLKTHWCQVGSNSKLRLNIVKTLPIILLAVCFSFPPRISSSPLSTNLAEPSQPPGLPDTHSTEHTWKYNC